MSVSVGKNGSNRQEGTEAAAQRSMRITLLLTFTILCVALAYFGALYLITH